MKRSRFTDSQIIAILKEAEAGVRVPDLCRQHGMSDATFYKWRAKIAAISLGGFGVIYRILMVALFLGAIASAEIETYFIGTSMLLLVHIVAMAFVFKRSMASLMSSPV